MFPGRIVNGVESSPHKFPWMAAMYSKGGHQYCGGAIISDRHILTAGIF